MDKRAGHLISSSSSSSLKAFKASSSRAAASSTPETIELSNHFQTGLSLVWISAKMITRKVIKNLPPFSLFIALNNAVVKTDICRCNGDNNSVQNT